MFRVLLALTFLNISTVSLCAKRDLLTGVETDDKTGTTSTRPRKYSDRTNDKPGRFVTLIVFPGASLPTEHAAILKSVWDDVKSECVYGDDGEIEKTGGEKLTDSPEMVDAFYRWLSKNAVKRRFVAEERCVNCRGSGVLVSYGETLKDKLQYTRNPCSDCVGTGKVRVNVEYTLVCPEERLPAKGRSPKLRRYDDLELSASKGDPKARIKLAQVLAAGTGPGGIDSARAVDLYFGLMAQGDLEALRGFIDMQPKQPSATSQIKFVTALEIALAKLKGTSALAVEPTGTPLDAIEVDVLAARFAYLFETKSLARRHLGFEGLSLAGGGPKLSPVRSIVARHLSSQRRIYAQEDLNSLMALAEKLDFEAFQVLGSISELGLSGPPNPKGAFIFYTLAQKLAAKGRINSPYGRISGAADAKTQEVLDFFPKVSTSERCSRTYIQSVFDFEEKSK